MAGAGLGERFQDWYAVRGDSSEHPEGESRPETERMPDEIVVTLAAIHELEPSVLRYGRKLETLMNLQIDSGLLGEVGSVNDLVRRKAEEHIKQLGIESWPQIGKYVPRFLRLWPSIDIQ